MSDLSRHIFDHVQRMPTEMSNDWLASIVNAELSKLTLSAKNWESSPCLLAEIGDLLTRTTRLLSRLAEGLADGAHIDRYAVLRTQDVNQETDGSDFSYLQYLEEKHKVLQKIGDRLKNTTADIDQLWSNTPAPPFSRQVWPATSSKVPSSPDRESSTGTEGTQKQTSEEPCPAYSKRYQEILALMRRMIADLKPRGKGNYTCPLGDECNKGSRGQVFKRNSEFREHLEKHVKMYKCELPGCKNTSGFARSDQLERHQMKVAHVV